MAEKKAKKRREKGEGLAIPLERLHRWEDFRSPS
jgi:hypothetical protein